MAFSPSSSKPKGLIVAIVVLAVVAVLFAGYAFSLRSDVREAEQRLVEGTSSTGSELGTCRSDLESARRDIASLESEVETENDKRIEAEKKEGSCLAGQIRDSAAAAEDEAEPEETP